MNGRNSQLVFAFLLDAGKRLLQLRPAGDSIRRLKSPIPCNIAPEDRLRALWRELIGRYFPERSDLLDYKVCWINRSTRTVLGTCHSEKRIVRVSRALEPNDRMLEAVLYHELCHAVLGVPKRVRGRRVMHGREFYTIERRHPDSSALDDWIKSGGWRKAAAAYKRKK